MSAFRVIEHLDVIENITSGFFTGCVDLSSDSLSLQKLEKALGYGIVVAVSRRLMLLITLLAFKKLFQSELLN